MKGGFRFDEDTVRNKAPGFSSANLAEEATEKDQERPEDSEPRTNIKRGSEALSWVFDRSEDCRTHRRLLATFWIKLGLCHRCRFDFAGLS